MAQETGTQILARARIIAQDNDANSNFAVGAATALILLNEILVSLNNNSKTKTKTLGGSTTGLSFASGDVSKLVSVDITEFESFHPANSSTLSYPLSPELRRVSVQEMYDLLGYDGDNTLGAQSSEWDCVAAEKTQDDTAASGVEKWRVYGWPVINRTRSMTVKAIVPVTIAAIGDYPDIDGVDSRVVSRLLAYEIAKLKKETSQQFLNNIINQVPREMLPASYGGAVRSAQLQSGIDLVRD